MLTIQGHQIDNNADLIKAWDANDNIWSVELGGLGPGYEQAIQILAFEIVRDNLHKDYSNFAATKSPLEDYLFGWDETVKRLDKKLGGFSGAQVGVAKWLAGNILMRGYPVFIAAMDCEPKNHMIQVNKRFPSWED